MSNMKKINSIYKDILSKVKYDSMNERYYIDIYDYVLYRLNKKQFMKLERICKENNIYLEKLPKIISYKDSDMLFNKLDELKKEISVCSDNEIVNKLNMEIDKIRTMIFEGYQQLIYRFIVMVFNDLDKSMYKDDVIQNCYICLINAIDNFDLTKGVSFRTYLYNYVSNNIIRNGIYANKEMISNSDLVKLIEVRERLEVDRIEITMERLIKETGFDEDRINDLLTLENFLYPDNIEELIGLEQNNDIDYEIDKCIFRELLLKIIDTLPSVIQKEIVIRYYGLDGMGSMNTIELSKEMGINRQLVHYHLSNALDNLKEYNRLKYIKELVCGYTDCEFRDEDVFKNNSKIKYEQLELYLLKQLPYDELLDLISLIEAKNREALSIYLGINNVGVSVDDITKNLGVSFNTYLDRRKRGLISLRKLINEKYIIGNENKDINDSMDYLMYRYLNGSKKRVRSR